MTTKRKIVIEHNGKEYIAEAMVIESASFGWEDHGILTFGVTCKGDGTGVTVGNMSLDSNFKNADVNTPDMDRGLSGRYGTAYGLDILMQVMDTMKVRNWNDLKGRSVLVLFEKRGEGTSSWGSMAVGIGHIVDEDKVLIFKEHADEWLKASGRREGGTT